MCAHMYFYSMPKRNIGIDWLCGIGDPDKLLSDLKRQSDMQIYTY